ncbi:hypothetical protein EZS27_030489 [termite gut metagenome]|uniref:HEPN AbiJ-N-terminal domain-containing protein n=1 Tax=termite gut metagenome TaxID=433724 RepID=A0A5J4QFT6_9ZZZZ
MRFSERYGYLKPSDVIIRERITPEIQIAICNCYTDLKSSLQVDVGGMYITDDLFEPLEKYLWRYVLNQRADSFKNNVVISFLEDIRKEWYRKLDLIEETIEFLQKSPSSYHKEICLSFTDSLNDEFKRLHFAYRIIDNYVAEITSEEEIKAIEIAMSNEQNSVKIHLQKALELYSKKPKGEYRNSIKESISAVEAFTREITGENVLNIKKMEEKGIVVPSVLRKAFETLYGYTNDKSTGIRHALMEDGNMPDLEEALFMLVSCSAFINYLTKKKSVVISSI